MNLCLFDQWWLLLTQQVLVEQDRREDILLKLARFRPHEKKTLKETPGKTISYPFHKPEENNPPGNDSTKKISNLIEKAAKYAGSEKSKKVQIPIRFNKLLEIRIRYVWLNLVYFILFCNNRSLQENYFKYFLFLDIHSSTVPPARGVKQKLLYLWNKLGKH